MSTAPRQRDLKIDLLRGLFILSLCGTHFSVFAYVMRYSSKLVFYDTQSFGISSPAECFVSFSGYVLALVAGKDLERVGFWKAEARVVHRAWQLYLLNAFCFLLVAALAPHIFTTGWAPAIFEKTRIDLYFADPVAFIGQFLLFQNYIIFFEILRNYIFFIPLVPIFMLIWRWNRWVAMGISVAIWLLHQLHLTPPGPFPTFNPYAWQLLFFMGASCALIKPLDTWTFPHRKLQIAVAFTLLILSFLAVLHFMPHENRQSFWATSKVDVAPLRILHFWLVVYTAMLLLPSSETIAKIKPARYVIWVGQNSLECFCASCVVVYIAGAVMTLAPHSVGLYWLLILAVMAAVMAVAVVSRWFKAKPWAPAKKATA